MRIALIAPFVGLFLLAPQAFAAEGEERFAYVSVAGAPGDGEQALAAALSRRLAAIGLKPATSFQASNVYEVQGTVRVAQAGKGREIVNIIWVVIDPGGNQLGIVRQARELRNGTLDKKWGGAADAAAEAAAHDIAALLPK